MTAYDGATRGDSDAYLDVNKMLEEFSLTKEIAESLHRVRKLSRAGEKLNM